MTARQQWPTSFASGSKAVGGSAGLATCAAVRSSIANMAQTPSRPGENAPTSQQRKRVNVCDGSKAAITAQSRVHESFSSPYRWQMSTKLIRNAADLVRFKTALKVECGRCGNAVTL